MTPETKSLIARAERYAKSAKLTLSTVSTYIFYDGKRLARLKDGARAWPETIEAASIELAALEASLPPKNTAKAKA